MFELFETIDKLIQIYTLDRFIQVVRNVAKNMGRLKSKKVNMILLITVLILLVPTTSSRSIHQINEIDIFPQGDFNDSTKWMIETQSGFSNLEAQNTDAMIADGKLSLTHQRTQNLKELLFWSTDSTSGHESAEGAPDGLISISSGPDIDLAGFDFSSIENYPLIDVSLVASFRISNGLNDDRVEISLSSSAGFFMIESYSNTFSQGEINYLSSPYITYDLGDYNEWTWDSISSSSVKLNYESVGGSDEAQLEVDGVAIKVVYQLPDSGFDFVKAETNLQLGSNYEYENLKLNLSGSIIGELGDVSPEFSWIKLQLGSDIIHEEKINNLTQNIEISLNLDEEEFLSLSSDLVTNQLLFAVGIQIYWNSDGSSSDAVIQIEDIEIHGVRLTEWDENPQCLELDDLTGNNSFVEDSGQYKIIPLRDNCEDDRTAKEDLDFSASTYPLGVIEAIIEDGHLKIFQIEDSFGTTEVIVDVFDTSGNSWSDSFFVEVLGINDPPIILDFPEEVWIELGSSLILEGIISDSESLTDELEFEVDLEIAVINSNNSITISPVEVGVLELNLLLSDGTELTTHKIKINTYTESELEPISVLIRDDQGMIISNNEYSSNSILSISTVVKNSGSVDATFVSVRYYFGDEMIGNVTIPLISAGSSQIAELSNWNLIGSPGEYKLRIVIDSNDLIQESNELNNEMIIDFRIVEVEAEEIGTINSEGIIDGSIAAIVILFGFIFISSALFFGPRKIQKIK